MSTSVVDTKKAERRKLRFETLDAMLAEARRVADAERAGRLRRTGNWTAGQVFGHLAGWATGCFDGFPPDVRPPPWILKKIFCLMKGQFLNKGLPVGIRIRGVEGGTKFTEPLSLDEGLARLERAAARLKSEAIRVPSPVFGDMSRDEWTKITLRHAELHMGFLHP